MKSVLGLDNEALFKSYIIFSERCTLKKINVTSANVKVLKRNQLIKMIKNDIGSSADLLTTEELDKLYCKLQQYTHADERVKKTHVDSIHAKRV